MTLIPQTFPCLQPSDVTEGYISHDRARPGPQIDKNGLVCDLCWVHTTRTEVEYSCIYVNYPSLKFYINITITKARDIALETLFVSLSRRYHERTGEQGRVFAHTHTVLRNKYACLPKKELCNLISYHSV